MGERQFGPYRLVHQIAVGGMAEIYLAKTYGIAGFEKYVALKMIHPNFSSDEQFVEMLIDEAKISVQLQHVNIAQTFDLGRVDDIYYITMEFVDGVDLYKLLRRSTERGVQVPVDIAAFIAKEMANGLDYAHRKRDLSGQHMGIVHRDVSPQNVLISHSGEVKLVDFGIAKATMKARQTAVGVIKGKYYYMSPEQAWGDRVDHRTDIFSAGICLYEALTGQMLYLEEDLSRLLEVVRRAEIAPPTTRRRDIPPQLERIVMNALQKDRDQRYQTAGDMATDLERFLHVYSPVFTASKVAEFFRQVFEDEQPPTLEDVPPAGPSDVPMHTMRLEADQILSDSEELNDENSLIFHLEAPAPPPAPAPNAAPVHTISTSAHTFVGGDYGSAHDLDNIEEQTMVSGPPGFGVPGGMGPDQYEETLKGQGMSPFAQAGDDVHDGPTLLKNDHGDLQERLRAHNQRVGAQPAARPPPRPAAPTSPPPRPPARPPAKGKASHPALAASTPKPAVSLTQSRRARRTPTDGVPAQQGPSVLSQLVGQDGSPPVRREPSSHEQATIPQRPGIQNSPPAAAGAPAPAPPDPSSPPAGAPGGAPGGPPGGAPGGAQPATPWPGSQPGAPQGGYPGAPTPTGPGALAQPGAVSYGGAQGGFSPLPTGQPPASFTKQLQSLELEEIPAAYKVGRKTPRWLLAGGLIAVCVAAGVGLGIFMLSGQERKSALLIESMPTGAKVTINGIELPDPTPVRHEVQPGQRYEIVFSRDGYQTKNHSVIVPHEGGDFRVPVTLQRVRLSVEVHSEPTAELFLNGSIQGMTPRTLSNLDPDNEYTIELRAKNHRTIQQKLVLDEDKPIQVLEFELEKQPRRR
ncbi:protein kinase domain-containing protein [Haliangium sp.]|uniref:serine/threonine protein kinase n=1 Tax=Haliangium sp. TaxID=2663208 RepID=UPI003D0E2FAE